MNADDRSDSIEELNDSRREEQELPEGELSPEQRAEVERREASVVPRGIGKTLSVFALGVVGYVLVPGGLLVWATTDFIHRDFGSASAKLMAALLYLGIGYKVFDKTIVDGADRILTQYSQKHSEDES